MNQFLLNMIRTKIMDSAKSFGVKYLVYELNKTPTSVLSKWITHLQIHNGRHNTNKLIFGCRFWYVVLPLRSKIDPIDRKAVVVGYCSGGYRLCLPTEEIIKSCLILFIKSDIT